MAIDAILAELDSEQRRSATVENNAVVAAGAGSGKTKVLAARYAWLVVERGYRVDEILTLTFTNKAVTEMYSRIYDLLESQQRDHPWAREALQNFHKAQIATLDSFCAGIARTASRRYGISPEFKIDNGGVRELALDLALPFVLDHRENQALQVLMSNRKIKTVADELFAETMLWYSPISSPLDFRSFARIQGEELLRRWDAGTKRASSLTDTIIDELGKITKTTAALYVNLKNLLKEGMPKAPGIAVLLENSGLLGDSAAPRDEIALRREIALYFEAMFRLKSISLSGRHAEEFSAVKDGIKELKNGVYDELESIANAALRSGITAAVFPLLDEFQRLLNRKKREAGLLTFADIARLAVDALSEYPDVRQVYKETIKAVMIDEFQDNNGLQRDLIFLLAEDQNRREKGVPRADELCPDKMFFVGDEKQSIYRFRGADVAVFRGLADTLSRNSAAAYLNLRYNYRSKPLLIEAFNRIFGAQDGGPGVFLAARKNAAAFEAEYNPIASPREAARGDAAPVHFCLLDKSRLCADDADSLSSYEIEAAFIALQIREMVDTEYPVQTRSGGTISARPCAYGDFAILERSYTHQHFLEKQLKYFNIPFSAGRPAGLFNDAPINDMYNFLRLLLYPNDRLAYAAVIRSPFARLSDAALSVCMLNGGVPFDEALDSIIPPGDLALYRRARERYEALREAVRVLPVTAVLTRLWYYEGYRYETVWSESSQAYGGLFDLFFELARNIDDRGKGMVDFIDYLDDLMNLEEKPDDLDIPLENEGGVRIMSIHKSKGLEFPVVFVYCCGSGGRNNTNAKAVYFHERWGVTLNLPQAEELPENSGNYFFKLQQEEEKRKEIAELRRLLYVAMTRAESALFLTAALPKQTQGDQPDGEQSAAGDNVPVTERLRQLWEKKQEKGSISSFLDLLLPVISRDGEPFFSIREIPAFSRNDLRRLGRQYRRRRDAPLSMKEAAQRAAAFYDSAEIITIPPPALGSIPASGLHYPAGEKDTGAEDAGASKGPVLEVDALLRKSGLDAAGFGTIVHGYIEAELSGRPPLIPPGLLSIIDEDELPRIKAEARNMTARFFTSELGSLCMKAAYRETEFPFLTVVSFKDMPSTGDRITVTGRIDLLFDDAQSINVVDFKTDRVEEPEKHLGQFAAYARAAGDIFGKPVRSWLFYLRSGHAVELTGRLEEVDLETLAES